MIRIFLWIALFVISAFASASAEQAVLFTMTSSSFAEKQKIPALYTCEGSDRSPSLAWKGMPVNTKTLVLIVEDPDAPVGIWYHWVLYNIPSTIKLLPEGAGMPAGVLVG